MKYFKVILVLLLFLACKNNKVIVPEKPDNLLSEDKMVEVIYDMSIVSAAKGVNKKLLEQKGIEPESYIYTLHNIDSLQFAESNNYYTYDLKTYERIYNRVKRKLQKDKIKFDTLVEVGKRKRDSISRLKKEEKENKKRKEENLIKPSFLKKVDTSQISTRQ